MNIGLNVVRTQNRVMSYIIPKRAVENAGRIFFTPRKHSSKEWETQAESIGRLLTLKNGASVIVWGEGIPILLMHGWEGRATQMSGFIKPLTSKGFQLFAIDAPAHGKSVGTQSNPARFIESIFLAEKSFGPFHAVIGHSMGGGCALYSVAEGLKTDKIVSISGPASFEEVSKKFASFIGLTDHVTEKFARHVEKIVGIPFNHIDALAKAPKIYAPALIVHDNNDEEIPFQDAQRIVNVMQNAKLYKTEGLGHRKIMRSNLMIHEVSNFITCNSDLFVPSSKY